MQRGFSLIQISIVLTVASLLLITILPGTQTRVTSDKSTAGTLNAVLVSLRNYETAYGRLPCPADGSQPEGSSTYGVAAANNGPVANCSGSTPSANFIDSGNNIAVGTIPVRSLGLGDRYAFDGYGRSISYAVDTNASTCWSALSLTGKIIVTDNGSQAATVAALVSHGANGHGAWVPLTGSSGSAVRLNSGSTNADELTNAHVDTSFNPASPLTNFVRKVSTGTFDDIVVYQSQLWNINSMPASIGAANVTLTPPSNGTYSGGQTLTFTFTFPQSVTVTGTPRLSLTALGSGSIGTGNKAYANYSGGSGTSTLTFTYLIQTSDTAPSGISITSTIGMNGGLMTPCFVYFTPPDLSKVVIGGGCGSYAYQRSITISPANVPNTDQINFPLLISGTYPYLAQGSGNGNSASVSSSSGYDIIFNSSAGSPLSFEQETYNPSTGQINYWVKIPTLSHTANTVISMCYGNPAVSGVQTTPSATWDSNFYAVWHLGGTTNLNTTDSTVNALSGTMGNSPTVTTGQIGSAGSFNGSNNINYGTYNPFPSGVGTMSAWFNMQSVGGNNNYLATKGNDAGPLSMGLDVIPQGSPTNIEVAFLYGAGNWTVNSNVVVNNGWNHMAAVANPNGTQVIYINGVAVATSSYAVITPTAGSEFNIASTDRGGDSYTGYYKYYANAYIDEVRLEAPRSADWIATEYNNQSSPSTFYSIGPVSAR